MKQLLSSCDDSILVALGKKAYLLSRNSNCVHELLKPSKENQSSEKAKTDEDLDSILAVALARSKVNSNELWCAVSRCDKTLAIYKLLANNNNNNDNRSTVVEECTLVYNTPKRVGQLCFAELPKGGEKDSTKEENYCLIAGDLAGDAIAYCLTKNSTKLLLGHTASMLTGVHVLGNRLLSADRDEKIRVSSFPETYMLEGYLMGHLEYISSMDAMTKDDINLVTSCGGYGTVRLWDLDTMEQLSEISTNDEERKLIPSNVALHPDGKMVAVIFDESNLLNVYSIEEDGDGKLRFGTPVRSMECSSQPLGAVFQDNETLMVLLKEPEYLVSYKIAGKEIELKKDFSNKQLLEIAAANDITMPDNILEKDDYGNITLSKINETRGPSNEKALPWNRIERVDIAKKRNARSKKRKLERRRENKDNTN